MKNKNQINNSTWKNIILTLILITLISFSIIKPDIAIFIPNATAMTLQKYELTICEIDNNTTEGEKIVKSIKEDLLTSDKFNVNSVKNVNKNKSIYNFITRANKNNHLALIKVNYQENDLYEIEFSLEETSPNVKLDNVSFSGSLEDMMVISHLISDRIYHTITGKRGIFSTKLAYIAKKNDIFELQISDYNGQNSQTALRSSEPIISPQWSPDGTKIAYVSFESGRPIIYIHDLFNTQRIILADHKGSNSAPSWSPDGTKIALSMTKTGLSQIYMLDLKDKNFRRIIQSSACDTEPSFSPDGQYIVFTSDRSGSQQIYLTDIYGQKVRRLTFNSIYNGSPKFSTDGKKIVYVKNVNNKFQICSIDLSSGEESMITHGENDQNPCLSPNGEYIIYSHISKNNFRSLSQISLENHQTKNIKENIDYEIFDPSWGPIINEK
ncbi:TolB protein [Candidatus Kinetoplastibacterium desouzaii TCC079E]|uniref:TolB protein n=1 Tax=Candidatus Kinetoplastidibacterium desouzai TCC079E TaxID=1208919 RepID=M1LSP7_9PROT|nr:Tol-Pal system beta propeller repeat protein TolB [Candidatus Kinetoplastibacterium desouzaii]AGF47136.1 TolB protein [Candidatus Kinetoplastibacterium desouzaii TCC079E]